ncbi:hypothetical protein C2G38_2032964 [Gigaspora rosea]|uniref:Uncharacterized protein n=1 Tax=Gigaspora rosea TaxID=44941 RepID=A0A397VPH2_9GLOM|nr:hypothetical protein C2G38_2032964 [Gigaspora rosea]
MATKLEINAKFLDCIVMLQRIIKGTKIAKIRGTATETSFIDNQRKPVNLSLLEGSITNPSTQAIESYLSNLQQIDISTRLPNLAPEGTLAEKLDAICEKILSGECDQVDLLQQYYYLGECLIEIAESFKD